MYVIYRAPTLSICTCAMRACALYVSVFVCARSIPPRNGTTKNQFWVDKQFSSQQNRAKQQALPLFMAHSFGDSRSLTYGYKHTQHTAYSTHCVRIHEHNDIIRIITHDLRRHYIWPAMLCCPASFNHTPQLYIQSLQSTKRTVAMANWMTIRAEQKNDCAPGRLDNANDDDGHDNDWMNNTHTYRATPLPSPNLFNFFLFYIFAYLNKICRHWMINISSWLFIASDFLFRI